LSWFEDLWIPTFDAQNNSGGTDVAGIDLPQLFDLVMSKGVAVVRGVFEPESRADLRGSVRARGPKNDPMPAQTYVDENFHSVESGISRRQKTVHLLPRLQFQ
jgi:hypothetical protein